MTAFWVNKLNESDSRLHKEDVLRQAFTSATLGERESQIFLGLLRATYDPFITWGVKQVPNTVELVDRENPWREFSALLSRLHTRTLTGNDARDAIATMSQRFDSEQWNGFCVNVLQKDIRAGISDKTINKVLKGTQYAVPTYDCQLATSGDDRVITGRQRLEPKLDGVRMLLHVYFNDGGVTATCHSRNGKIFENFSHIEHQVLTNISALLKWGGSSLINGFVLDGEVIGSSFQNLMRQARRKKNVDIDDTVFHVFDVIPLDEFRNKMWNCSLERRTSILHSMKPVFERMRSVALLPSIEVDLDYAAGKDQLRRFGQDCVAQGYEGVMIKSLDAPYECTRNTNWLKYKPVHDYDLIVVGLEEGTGKNIGRLGALVCCGIDDGKKISVNVGSGFTDIERQQYWDNKDSVIGQTAVVFADAITQNRDGSYSLRFPRFKTFRDDK